MGYKKRNAWNFPGEFKTQLFTQCYALRNFGLWTKKFFFLYFVIDFLTGNNRDFILFCHTMAEKLTNVKKQVEKIFFHLFLGKTSGKKIFPLVFGQNKWKNFFSTCFLTFVNFSAIVWQKSMKSR